jgi:hypothetical protein
MRATQRAILLALLVPGLIAATPSAGRAEVTENLKVPTDIGVYIPCADGGAGELVTLSGDLHVLVRFTQSKQGGIHAGVHFQPQGITGVGDTTGDRYQATGVTQDQFNATVGVEETFINNFRIIGQGTGNNYLVQNLFHITINPNGTLTAFVDRLSVDCR